MAAQASSRPPGTSQDFDPGFGCVFMGPGPHKPPEASSELQRLWGQASQVGTGTIQMDTLPRPDM